MSAKRPSLLAIVELGGYPNFTSLYARLGFEVEFVNSQRRAQAKLKKSVPDVIVAEFNFQSDFRDRTSNLESLMARLQGGAQEPGPGVLPAGSGGQVRTSAVAVSDLRCPDLSGRRTCPGGESAPRPG